MAMYGLTVKDVYHAARTGEYPLLGEATPDMPKVVLSWGTALPVNRAIVEFGLQNNTDSTPLVADENAARHFRPDEREPMTFIGSISTHRYGRRPGTSGILRATRRWLGGDDSERPALRIATHAHMAARTALQAYLEGFEPVLEPGMPRLIDASSEQPWTQSLEAWVAYERKFLVAYSALKAARGKLPLKMLHW